MAQKKKPQGDRKIPLVWGENPELRTVHANHVWLTQQQGDVYLVFGELLPLSPKPDAPPREAVIRPVARLSLSPEALVRVTRLLADNVDLTDVEQS